jgi:hypothetical protein
MPVRLARERLIRRVWTERGKALWEARKAPGPLIVDVSSLTTAPAPSRRAKKIKLPTSLTYEQRLSTVNGKTVNEIMCENVVVARIPSSRL